MSPADRDALIELVAGAFRERGAEGQIQSAPAFHDLDGAGRQAAHARALQIRELEAALDPDGLSSTARAVLRRITERS